jgi:hypothetical protein
MVTKGYIIRGVFDGKRQHRNRESFSPSCYNDFTGYCEGDGVRILRVLNSDILGTNDYNVVIITRRTTLECDDEMFGQWSDGIFENCNVDIPIELDSVDVQKYINMFDRYNHNRLIDVSNCNKMIDTINNLNNLATSLSPELINNLDGKYGECYRNHLFELMDEMGDMLRNILDVAQEQRNRTNYIHQKEC